MMSILSYLLGSRWLLITGQHSTATFHFSYFSDAPAFLPPQPWSASSYLLHSFLLTLNKEISEETVSENGQSAVILKRKPQK